MSLETCVYRSRVFHLRSPFQLRGKDELLIILKLFRMKASRCQRTDPFTVESRTLAVATEFWVNFSSIKQSNNRSEYTQMIAGSLSSMGVPEAEHPTIIENIYLVLDVAVSPELPVIVAVWDMTCIRCSPDLVPAVPNIVVPATSSSIEEGLEEAEAIVAETPSCVICTEDLPLGDEQLINRLPCKHHFHVHCILRWLEISGVCPLCRSECSQQPYP
ncbi:putative transcription factor C2H2 family [Rosa chinensis]|uniref:RING-type E3 ubiquitin transferase n=1 Tax=Rosa chinensis TaxID=74649 RepID=A0A2P6RY88_ROSCH|nr:putative transcription factor C2H2 family [Rosa chinensis]